MTALSNEQSAEQTDPQERPPERCQERVVHRWGWGYTRPCAFRPRERGDDGRWRCALHAQRYRERPAAPPA